MAKIKIYEMTKTLGDTSRELFEDIKQAQGELAELLAQARVIENEFLEKAYREEEERRLKEAEQEWTAPATPSEGYVISTEELLPSHAPEPVQETSEPESAPAAVKTEEKQEEAVALKTPQVIETPELPQTPEASEAPAPVEQEPAARPAARKEQGWETARAPSADMQSYHSAPPPAQRQSFSPGDRGPRPQGQGGYAPRPQGQGGYGPRPQGQGGYTPRPQGQGGYGPRPQGQQGGYGPRPSAAAPAPAGASGKERVSNYDPNRANYQRNYDMEKRARARRNMAGPMPVDDERHRKVRRGRGFEAPRPEPIRIEHAVLGNDRVTVKDLSEKIGKPASEIIKKLFMIGVMATINQEIDFDTCALIASDFGITLELKMEKTAEEVLVASADLEENPLELIERPPVVTVMGHVDHGKTSLLDAIRHTHVTSGEAGGITQHIGAYMIEWQGRKITFLDTPGHEAFTSMRARGAKATDIAILVVAADDGIMPQTVEAINHAKAASVPIIVAINKIDRPEADTERIKQQLTEHELLVEEWGGDIVCVPVSAKTGEGIDQLLEMVLLSADVLELRANPNRMAKGIIIEAQLDKGRGPVATVLVQSGTLHIGDTIVAGTAYGRVRAMMDDKGVLVESAMPSMPVEVLGFSEVPEAGDVLHASEVDKLSRQVAEERRDKQRAEQIKTMAKVSLDDIFAQIAEGQIKDLNIILKGDVQGSVEALRQALDKLSNTEVRVRVIHGGVGAITGSDVMLASASNAIIIGFNVRPDAMARVAAERERVDVRLYRVIYSAIEDIEKALKGMLAPEFKEVALGTIRVRAIFKVSGVGTIAGAYVQDGKVTRNSLIRVVRDGIVIHEGKIDSLKRFKDDAKEVLSGFECGIGLENFNDIREEDILEAYIIEEVKRD